MYQGDCPDDEDEDSQAFTGIIVILPATPPPSAHGAPLAAGQH